YYDLLSLEQQQILNAASVFAPNVPFTHAALEAVFHNKIPPSLSLLIPVFITEIEGGYQIPFSPQLKNSGGFRQRHLSYYEQRAEHWTPDSPGLEAEVGQYGQALRYAAPEKVVNMVLTAGQFLQTIEAYHSPLAAWLEYVLMVADQQGNAWGQAGEMRALGDIAVRIRQLHSARTFYYRALLLYDTTSLAGQAHTLKGLGDLNMQGNNLQSAREFYYKALVVYELNDFKLGQANIMRQLAPLSDSKTAHEYYEKALDIYRELEFQVGEAQALKELADLYFKEGDTTVAQTHYESALRIFHAIGFWVEEGHILKAIGDMHLKMGDEDSARTHYDRALKLYEKAGSRHGQGNILRAMGDIALQQNRHNAALALFRQARDLYESVDAYSETAAVNQLMAFLRLEQGSPAEALRHMQQAMAGLDHIGAVSRKHEAENRLREIAMRIGDDFPVLWKEVTGDAPLSRRLQDILNPALQNALHSPEALRQAIQGHILRQVAHLETEVRTRWLQQALDLLTENTADSHLNRAVVYKELAAVPDQNLGERLRLALAEYDAALLHQKNEPAVFAQTQSQRIALLRDMAGLPGEDRMARLYQALEGFESALACLTDSPTDYAGMQLQRANLIRELAGLNQERGSRADWMYKALSAYDEVLLLLPDTALEYAMAHTNRASLLQEIAALPHEDRAQRLKQALTSAVASLHLLEKHGESARSLRLSTQKLTTNIRDTVVA
ncbi:MAG: tetratricopeptide repeat protein, partial [Anaerolineae bacterium]|nr:tetratricopeptide repeat protein [Anaerolineae bacterium]